MVKRSTGMMLVKSKRGLLTKLAKGLRLDVSVVSRWKQIPAERVVQVEKITGIPREELRPDLYRRETKD